MLQNLLADRFRLVLKHELRELPVYALTVADPGKLKLSPDETLPVPVSLLMPGIRALPMPPLGRGKMMGLTMPTEAQMAGHAISMQDLAKALRPHAGRIVVDKTGMNELFDIDLKFSRDTLPSPAVVPAAPPTPVPPLPAPPIPGAPPATQPLAPPLRNVLEDRLGLKLESVRMPIEVLIIERVERPSEN